MRIKAGQFSFCLAVIISNTRYHLAEAYLEKISRQQWLAGNIEASLRDKTHISSLGASIGHKEQSFIFYVLVGG